MHSDTRRATIEAGPTRLMEEAERYSSEPLTETEIPGTRFARLTDVHTRQASENGSLNEVLLVGQVRDTERKRVPVQVVYRNPRVKERIGPRVELGVVYVVGDPAAPEPIETWRHPHLKRGQLDRVLNASI